MRNLSSLRVSDPDQNELKNLQQRQRMITEVYTDLPHLFSDQNLPQTVGKKNCENWVGGISIPVGIAGPITINFNNQIDNYYIPLATTEGALVASVSRGAKALASGKAKDSVKVIVKKQGMSRAPVFECGSGEQAFQVFEFVKNNIKQIIEVAEKTSNHLQYLNHQGWVRGKYLYLRFNFDTDQAMGMNMVTIATQAIATFIESKLPFVKLIALSSNVCTDKKDNVINSLLGRGYYAQAEAVISKKVLKEVLKIDSKKIIKIHIQKNLVGSNLAGSFSQNAHVANILAGLYLATGQDVAHIVDGSKAFLSLSGEGEDLYVSLTMPNLNMGIVGGGTYLPSQKEARELIGLGEIETDKLVAVTVVACLAGELSLLASLGENTLAKAHQNLGRI